MKKLLEEIKEEIRSNIKENNSFKINDIRKILKESIKMNEDGGSERYDDGTAVYGGQKMSLGNYEDMKSYEKDTLDGMRNAFKTPDGYQMKNKVQRGIIYRLNDGSRIEVLKVTPEFIKVRNYYSDEDIQEFKPKKPFFDINWSPVQFDAIINGSQGKIVGENNVSFDDNKQLKHYGTYDGDGVGMSENKFIDKVKKLVEQNKKTLN